MWRLLGVEDVNTGHIAIEHRLTNPLFSLFFCPFVFCCCTPIVSSTPSKSHKATKLCEIIKLNTCKESCVTLIIFWKIYKFFVNHLALFFNLKVMSLFIYFYSIVRCCFVFWYNYSRHIPVAMLIPGYLLTSFDYIIEQ